MWYQRLWPYWQGIGYEGLGVDEAVTTEVLVAAETTMAKVFAATAKIMVASAK